MNQNGFFLPENFFNQYLHNNNSFLNYQIEKSLALSSASTALSNKHLQMQSEQMQKSSNIKNCKKNFKEII